MAIRKANAKWTGGLRNGKGTVSVDSGAFKGANYSFSKRFEDEPGTNPEELIAAAHSACYSMALSAGLEKAGFTPDSVETEARIDFQKTDDGWRIVNIHLVNESTVPGIDEAEFQEQAEAAKTGCPISNALKAVDITLDAKLVRQQMV